jgi:hypothetical protein
MKTVQTWRLRMHSHDSLFNVLSYLHNAWDRKLPEAYEAKVAALTSTASVLVEVK